MNNNKNKNDKKDVINKNIKKKYKILNNMTFNYHTKKMMTKNERHLNMR